MFIYTRTGDDGTTAVIGGRRLGKNTFLIQIIGEIDELNSYLGLCQSFSQDRKSNSILNRVQGDLFEIGALVASSGKLDKLNPVFSFKEEVFVLEKFIDYYSKKLLKLSRFILPGGSKEAALLHCARSVCRRVERGLVEFDCQNPSVLDSSVLPFVNRLSDLLFVLARYQNKLQNVADVKWLSNTPKDRI
ncbi:MAG: cob(I)yrinic acid a,c-diamide adenosyltransferase [Patescibacteria group bacterium]